MVKDIVPDLLNNIQESFQLKKEDSIKLKKLLEKLDNKKATYEDASEYAIEVGEILSSVFKERITVDSLPDGKMYFNIAKRVLTPTIKENYQLVSDYTSLMQQHLNEQAGIRIKGQKVPINKDRVDGIVQRVSNEDNFDDIKWILVDPIIQFTQSVVDDTLKQNADFHFKSGLQPYINRTVSGHKPCKWCRALAGRYRYPDDVPDDVYRRHAHCRCRVTYMPDKKSKKVQDVHSKRWHEKQRNDIIEERKMIGKAPIQTGAKNYFRDESNDDFLDEKTKRREKHAYREYDRIKNSDQKLEKRKIFNNISRFKEMKDFSKKDVDIAFNHVFNDLHELEDGRMLFEPDYEMAQSWNRLINNKNIQEHDLVLLRHERLEHHYMYNKGMKYQEAHDKVSEIYFYKSPKED